LTFRVIYGEKKERRVAGSRLKRSLDFLLTEQGAIDDLQAIEDAKKQKFQAQENVKNVATILKINREKKAELKKLDASIKKQTNQQNTCSKQLDSAKSSADNLKTKFDKDSEKWRAKYENACAKVVDLNKKLVELRDKLAIEKGFYTAKEAEIIPIDANDQFL
jgi:uncharacterized coiled-coil DUF342 family protein